MGFKGSEVQILSPRPKHLKQISGLPQGVGRFFCWGWCGCRDGFVGNVYMMAGKQSDDPDKMADKLSFKNTP
jgi:hypothetical protein